MMNKEVTINIQNEVDMTVSGLHGDHIKLFHEKYSLLAANYFFNPQYKLGRWDGKIAHFTKAGSTYVYLLPEILKSLYKFGYKVNIKDHRSTNFQTPELADDQIFVERPHPDNGKPIVLRDYQVDAINALTSEGTGICLAGTGAGKALTLDSLILTTSGWVANKDITLDHYVITPENNAARVLGVYPQGVLDIYEITFDDGTFSKCSYDHLWEVNYSNNTNILTTKEISQLLEEHISVTIPINGPVNYFNNTIQEAISPWFPLMVGTNFENIPDITELSYYQYTNASFRILFLKGILSNCECNSDNEYITVSLADDHINFLVNLVRSLGGWCVATNNCVTIKLSQWLNNILIDDSGKIRSILNNNSVVYHSGELSDLCRKIISIAYIGQESAQCILVDDPRHLYITNDYVVTHNTIICAGLLQQYTPIVNKSITIVPDQNLIMQTKRTYIACGLDVGEYSGKHKELDHKHIVSTWQALNKNPHLMSSFDLLLIDECHGTKATSLKALSCEYGCNIPYRFGVTGTLPKEPIDELSVHIAVGEVKISIKAHELIEKNVLAKLQIVVNQTEENFVSEYEEYKNSCIMTKPISYRKFKDQYFPDFSAEKSYLQHNSYRLEFIADMIIKERDERGNILCLVNSIPAARKLSKLIPGSHCVNGQDVKDPKKRQVYYDMFENHNDLVVIATVHIASTGLSIDRIFSMFVIDIGKSFTRVIQSVGRGLRKSDDKHDVKFYDVCCDLKNGNKHLKDRLAYYTEAQYPYVVQQLRYN
jgi:superfamily II DNA or RNA helicase